MKTNEMCFKSILKQNKHLYLLLYFLIYLVSFFTIDGYEAKSYFIIRCPLDDLIPFNQMMVIPYSIWFIWFTGWMFFLAWRSSKELLTISHSSAADMTGKDQTVFAKSDFIKTAFVMFVGMTLSLITYIIWPNGVDLREPITTTDIFSKMVIMIREADTPYGVCPSIHVSTIVAILLTVRDSKQSLLNTTVKVYTWIITLMIMYSTMAIKQHSIVDVAAGALLSVILYIIYEKFLKEKAEAFFE